MYNSCIFTYYWGKRMSARAAAVVEICEVEVG